MQRAPLKPVKPALGSRRSLRWLTRHHVLLGRPRSLNEAWLGCRQLCELLQTKRLIQGHGASAKSTTWATAIVSASVSGALMTWAPYVGPTLAHSQGAAQIAATTSGLQTAAVEDHWAQLVSFASHICMPMCATGQLATDEHANVALSMHSWCEAALLLATFHCSIAICA